MEGKLAEVEQQVLATCLDSLQPAAVKPLYSCGPTTVVTGPNPEFLPAHGYLGSPRGPQDCVALPHALST
jgi:hypothetical protein